MSIFSSDQRSLKSKIGDELKTLFVLTLYLGVFFSALSYLKFAILQKVDIPYVDFGLGLIRAIVCAKFMMISKTLYPIKTTPNKPLLWYIVNRSLLYVLIVIVLNVLEEILMAKIHGTQIINTIIGVETGTINQFLALVILYWLAIIPYVAYSTVSQAIGGIKFYQLIFVNGNLHSEENK